MSITSIWNMDIAGKIRRFGKTKRIVSYHNLKATPVDIQDIAEKSDELDPDIVKMATSASTLAEASRVLHLGVTGKFPTIPIAMGEIGVFTRILGAKFGAPFTYAGFNPERVFARGHAAVSGPEERLLLQSDRLQDRGLRCHRRSDRAEPEPRDPQCRVPPPGLNKVLVPFLVPDRRAGDVLPRAHVAGNQGLQRDDSAQGGDRPPSCSRRKGPSSGPVRAIRSSSMRWPASRLQHRLSRGHGCSRDGHGRRHGDAER